jgi:nucleoside-diphosphate-sugar epimerase
MRALLLAGNGVIGSRTAVRLADQGIDVTVHHGGRRPAPAGEAITALVVPRTDPPIVEFPAAATSIKVDTVIHFFCMGGEDAAAFVSTFDGKASRLVLISSCDVYRAYGRFTRLEPGPPDSTPIAETGPLRTHHYPYRASAPDPTHLHYWYEKLEAERHIAQAKTSEFVILRLPKVYGRHGNDDLGTVYGFADQPNWRWTHGYVENVAAAIATAALHPRSAGEIFNVGELDTPTMGERLTRLPEKPSTPPQAMDYDFAQDLNFRTSKIRSLIGYQDVVDEGEAMRAVAAMAPAK